MRFGITILSLGTAFSLVAGPLAARATRCDDEFRTNISAQVDEAIANLEATLASSPMRRPSLLAKRGLRRDLDLAGLHTLLVEAFGDPERAIFDDITRSSANPVGPGGGKQVVAEANRLTDELLKKWRALDHFSKSVHDSVSRPFVVGANFELERRRRAGALIEDEHLRMMHVLREHRTLNEHSQILVSLANFLLDARTDLPVAVRADLRDCLAGRDLTPDEYMRVPSVARRARAWTR